MTYDRRRLWVLGVAVAFLGALAWGIPLATLLTIVALLACPAAMFFGMGMMGRSREGGMACQPGAPENGRDATAPASLPGPRETAPVATTPPETNSAAIADGDPLLILKRRLAAGQIALEEYERLAAVLSGAPAPSADAAPEEVTHAAG